MTRVVIEVLDRKSTN